MSEFLNVTNNNPNASVLVAAHTIAPGATKPIREAELKKWVEKKGGETFLKAGTISINHIGAALQGLPARHVAHSEPAADDKTPTAFDGSPLSTIPQEGGVEDAPKNELDARAMKELSDALSGLPGAPVETIKMSQAMGNDGEVEEGEDPTLEDEETKQAQGDEPKEESKDEPKEEAKEEAKPESKPDYKKKGK